jgi:hypothetical protein
MGTLVTPGAITICRNCNAKFDIHAPLPVGKGLDRAPESERKLMALIFRLGDHLARAHKDENRILEYRAAEFLGMLRILEFKSTEPELLKQVDLLRWTMLQKLIGVRLTNDVIAADSKAFAEIFLRDFEATLQADFGFELAFWQPVIKHLRSMIEARVDELVRKYRDMVEEPNKWVVDQPVEAEKQG